MTRFWITIKEGVELVEKSFFEMLGGEIFVPIIPSIKITDLAKAMAPTLKQKIIGIRPGEKIHEELMISKDDAPNVLKLKVLFDNPQYSFSRNINMFKKSKSKEIGKKVNLNFEYNSGTNSKF